MRRKKCFESHMALVQKSKMVRGRAFLSYLQKWPKRKQFFTSGRRRKFFTQSTTTFQVSKSFSELCSIRKNKREVHTTRRNEFTNPNVTTTAFLPRKGDILNGFWPVLFKSVIGFQLSNELEKPKMIQNGWLNFSQMPQTLLYPTHFESSPYDK